MEKNKLIFTPPQLDLVSFDDSEILMVSTETEVGHDWDEFIDSGN